MSRTCFPWLLALALSAALPARADCELLYAPPAIRARLLAFHYANELRREHEQHVRRRDAKTERATDAAAGAGPAPQAAVRARARTD